MKYGVLCMLLVGVLARKKTRHPPPLAFPATDPYQVYNQVNRLGKLNSEADAFACQCFCGFFEYHLGAGQNVATFVKKSQKFGSTIRALPLRSSNVDADLDFWLQEYGANKLTELVSPNGDRRFLEYATGTVLQVPPFMTVAERDRLLDMYTDGEYSRLLHAYQLSMDLNLREQLEAMRLRLMGVKESGEMASKLYIGSEPDAVYDTPERKLDRWQRVCEVMCVTETMTHDARHALANSHLELGILKHKKDPFKEGVWFHDEPVQAGYVRPVYPDFIKTKDALRMREEHGKWLLNLQDKYRQLIGAGTPMTSTGLVNAIRARDQQDSELFSDSYSSSSSYSDSSTDTSDSSSDSDSDSSVDSSSVEESSSFLQGAHRRRRRKRTRFEEAFEEPDVCVEFKSLIFSPGAVLTSWAELRTRGIYRDVKEIYPPGKRPKTKQLIGGAYAPQAYPPGTYETWDAKEGLLDYLTSKGEEPMEWPLNSPHVMASPISPLYKMYARAKRVGGSFTISNVFVGRESTTRPGVREFLAFEITDSESLLMLESATYAIRQWAVQAMRDSDQMKGEGKRDIEVGDIAYADASDGGAPGEPQPMFGGSLLQLGAGDLEIESQGSLLQLGAGDLEIEFQGRLYVACWTAYVGGYVKSDNRVMFVAAPEVGVINGSNVKLQQTPQVLGLFGEPQEGISRLVHAPRDELKDGMDPVASDLFFGVLKGRFGVGTRSPRVADNTCPLDASITDLSIASYNRIDDWDIGSLGLRARGGPQLTEDKRLVIRVTGAHLAKCYGRIMAGGVTAQHWMDDSQGYQECVRGKTQCSYKRTTFDMLPPHTD